MNSRDAAAYDEMMALLVEHSAAEAAAAVAAQSPTSPYQRKRQRASRR
jgi:hypothetical protein